MSSSAIARTCSLHAAMGAHNAGPASAGFLATAGDRLDRPVSVFIGEEIDIG